jgi:hypothetical protein
MRRGAARSLRAAALVGLVSAGSPALAAKTDLVVLRNGDRVTGEVQQLERGRLRVDTDDMGTLEIEWDKVTGVSARAQFDVEDLQGRRYVGSLEPTPAAGEVRISSAAGARVVRLLELARLQRLQATFWKRLDGSLDLGTSYTSGSELFKLDAAATIRTHRPGYEVAASGSAAVTTQPGVEDSSRNVFAVVYSRRFENRWLALARGQLEQNSELGFDLRSSLAAGGGRYFLQRRSDRLAGSLGLSVNREKPAEGESTTNLELTAILTYDRFAHDFPKVDVSIGAALFVSLSDPGRQRFELEGRLKRELVRDFYASIRGYESYDSRPPAEQSVRSDWGVTLALGWSF